MAVMGVQDHQEVQGTGQQKQLSVEIPSVTEEFQRSLEAMAEERTFHLLLETLTLDA